MHYNGASKLGALMIVRVTAGSNNNNISSDKKNIKDGSGWRRVDGCSSDKSPYPEAVPSPFSLWVKAFWAKREKHREQNMI